MLYVVVVATDGGVSLALPLFVRLLLLCVVVVLVAHGGWCDD